MAGTVAIDPRVAAIMAKFEEEEEEEREKEEKKNEPKQKPPTNLEEFLAIEKLEDWPYPMATEGPLDLENEALLLGSQEDIAAIIRDSAPIGLHMMEDLESDLEELEKKLKFYADQILTDEETEDKKVERLPFSSARTFLTEMTDSDAVKTHHSAKVTKSLDSKSGDFAESMLETRKKTIEFCQFPGFRHGELVELPAQIESLPILHKITKAQDFNPGFKKFWKKLFLSEASVAVLQDTFWWIFLHHFDEGRNRSENMSLIYDRIADSYVALFTSIHNDVKDKFLAVYPNCLAQAVYLIYHQAFPESSNKLADDFKQFLCNTVFEWITGIKPNSMIFKEWDIRKMETDSAKGKKAEKQMSETTQKIMQAAALNKEDVSEVSASLDMESFHKVIDNLGGATESRSSARMTPQGASREITKVTNFSLPTNGTVPSQQGVYTSFSRTSPSRLATCGSTVRRKTAKQSHQIGPGPEYERVMFNVQGRSPLISHYLHMRQLRDFHQPGMKVRRTEIAAIPPDGPTYKQLIQKSIAMSEAIQKEYQKICEETDQEIYELKKKQRESNMEFNRLSKELKMTKNPLDLKILSDKIIELYTDFPASQDSNGYQEREREAILLDNDTDIAPSVNGEEED